MTEPNQIMGTPHYMPPEVLESARRASVQSDIWALGVTLYEMLTGAMPFDAETPVKLYMMMQRGRPVSIRQVRPEISSRLEQVVMHCLAPQASDRFASVAELVEALAVAAVPSGEVASHMARVRRIIEDASARASGEGPASSIGPESGEGERPSGSDATERAAMQESESTLTCKTASDRERLATKEGAKPQPTHRIGSIVNVAALVALLLAAAWFFRLRGGPADSRALPMAVSAAAPQSVDAPAVLSLLQSAAPESPRASTTPEASTRIPQAVPTHPKPRTSAIPDARPVPTPEVVDFATDPYH